MKFSLYCKCGTGMEGVIPLRDIGRLREAWEKAHSGPHCEECDRKTALKASRALTPPAPSENTHE